MHFYPDKRLMVLDGELDFGIDDEAHEVYKRLSRIAEDVGACVDGHITHGGYIKVFPAFSSSYYVLGVYSKLDEKKFEIPGQYAVTNVAQFSKIRDVWFDNSYALKEISIP